MGTNNPPPTDEKPIDEVYHDRNLLPIAFTRAISPAQDRRDLLEHASYYRYRYSRY